MPVGRLVSECLFEPRKGKYHVELAIEPSDLASLERPRRSPHVY
jgi:hypothetical protein